MRFAIDDGQPVGRFMNEMRFHCGPLALDKVLAWMMEVKLLQHIRAVVHVEHVARCKAELNSVAVIDDGLGVLAPIQSERWLCSANGAMMLHCEESH